MRLHDPSEKPGQLMMMANASLHFNLQMKSRARSTTIRELKSTSLPLPERKMLRFLLAKSKGQPSKSGNDQHMIRAEMNRVVFHLCGFLAWYLFTVHLTCVELALEIISCSVADLSLCGLNVK